MTTDKKLKICIRGHEVGGDNLFLDKRGRRVCKKCKAILASEYYLRHRTQMRKHDREVYKLKRVEILQQVKKYQKTEAGKKSLADNSRRMYRKYTYKWLARSKAKYAVKSGRLAHLACEVCHNFLSEAHHPDYSKPLDVWWLCRKHHKMADKGVLILYV